MDHTTAFREAILSHGWDPGPVYPDGRLHRFSEPERRNKTCWYVLHDMGTFAAGVFGNWREGTSHKWTSRNGTGLSEDEWRAWQGKQAEIEARQKSAQAKAKERAAFIWSHAAPAPADHGYLINKGIKPHIARLYKGMLAIPVIHEGELTTAQLISADSMKRFLKGGKTKGGYAELPGTGTPIAGEGFATMASIHEATGARCIIAFNCGNLEPVADMLFKEHGRNFIIAADNDKYTTKKDGTPWNVGKEKALALAWKYNVKVALPDVGAGTGTDFNDVCTLSGPETVKKQIDAALLPKDWLLKECQENGPGAAYRPENIEGLKLLKERDPAGYRDLRERLRRLRTGITDLEKELNKARTGQDGTGSHLTLAKKVIESFGKDNILYSNGWFWLWKDTGVWKRADDREIKTKIQEITKALDSVTRATVDSVLDMVKTACYRAEHVWDQDTTTINTLSGELAWTGMGWELRPHVKEHYRTTQIPVKYVVEAECPRTEQFLEQITAGDPDALDKMILLCECAGYCLLSTSKFEKFFLLEGGGSNGKSVFMGLVTDLVGRENVSAIPPSRFGDKFSVAHLNGKLANIVSEIGIGAEISDSDLKALTSGDLVSAEQKFKEPFEYRSFATNIFGTNHGLRTKDFSEAFFRRAIPIPFTNTFDEQNQDKNLSEKLRAELSGFLNLALDALTSVLKRGHFTRTESSQRAWEQWRLQTDQIRAFCEDKIIFDNESETPTGDLFSAYTEWAEDMGIKRTVAKNSFSNRMARLGAEQKKGKGGLRILAGVRLRTEMDF